MVRSVIMERYWNVFFFGIKCDQLLFLYWTVWIRSKEWSPPRIWSSIFSSNLGSGITVSTRLLILFCFFLQLTQCYSRTLFISLSDRLFFSPFKHGFIEFSFVCDETFMFLITFFSFLKASFIIQMRYRIKDFCCCCWDPSGKYANRKEKK